MAQNDNGIVLNLGCGFRKLIGAVNVDAYDICRPDVVHDLNVVPYPWEDNSVDKIISEHVFEHLPKWWDAFKECVRILKPDGTLTIAVPHAGSITALTYRDHCNVFSLLSFHGIMGPTHGTNAWAKIEESTVPVKLINYELVPHKKYEWMTIWCPWLLSFLANHMLNFVWEQRFTFKKIGG